MTRAVEQAPSTVPRQLARQVRADRRNGLHRVAAPEEKGTHAAGCDAPALALDQVGYRGNVDPPPTPGIDRLASDTRNWTRPVPVGRLQRPGHEPARDCAGGHSQTRDERRSPRHPRAFGGRFQRALQPLAEGRVHALGAMARGDQPRGGGDRGFLLGVSAAQAQTAASQEVGNYLVDSVLGSVHGVCFTLAAARRARSCITLTAPTVEFISLATSLSEYPCRKRSSSTRR